jgi:hypothetical protein
VRILWCSLLSTGSAHVVIAGALSAAFRRGGIDVEFRLLHGTEFDELARTLGLDARRIPRDPASVLLGTERGASRLFEAIESFNPDVFIVEGSWFAFHDLIAEIDARKYALFFGMLPEFYTLTVGERQIVFNPDSYDHVYTIEPFTPPFPAESFNPMILRNRNEILSREKAAAALGLDGNRPAALVAINGRPGEFEELKQTYSYLEEEYQVVYSSNYHGGVFPAIDYYNAFDFVVCGAGYSQFWEARYFEKDAHVVPQIRRFENQALRLEQYSDYVFSENGADQLARSIIENG